MTYKLQWRHFQASTFSHVSFPCYIKKGLYMLRVDTLKEKKHQERPVRYYLQNICSEFNLLYKNLKTKQNPKKFIAKIPQQWEFSQMMQFAKKKNWVLMFLYNRLNFVYIHGVEQFWSPLKMSKTHLRRPFRFFFQCVFVFL